MNNKGMEYYQNWAEIFFTLLLIIGFVLSLSSGSAFISYATIVLAGLLFGRILHDCKKKVKFPYYLIALGFLIGFLLGDFYANVKTLVILFIVSNILSYWLHDKGYIEKGIFG